MMRREKMVRQIFKEIIKQNEFTPEAWKKVKIKVIHKEETWKMLVTTARSAHCQRCTNCSRQCCTADKIRDSNKKQAEDQAGFRSSYQTTDHLATNRMIEQKCHEWRI